MNTYTKGELDTFDFLQTAIEVSYGTTNSQAIPDSSLGIVLVSLGIAEVHKDPVTKARGDMPIVALDDFRTSALIRTDYVPVLFGIELGGELRGIDQVAEHHGVLP